MTNEIIIAGFGGQGILFAGKILAYAGLISESEVSWLPSYGPEMRGGTANCSVCISDEPVGSPLVVNPNYFIAMNEPSFKRFIDKIKAGGKAFIDSTMIKNKCERKDVDCFYIPATKLAEDNNLNGMANIILIGKMIKETQIMLVDLIKKAIEKSIPSHKSNLLDANLRALSLGLNY